MNRLAALTFAVGLYSFLCGLASIAYPDFLSLNKGSSVLLSVSSIQLLLFARIVNDLAKLKSAVRN